MLLDEPKMNADFELGPGLATFASFSTIGGGVNTTILSAWRSPKQPLPGIGLHDDPAPSSAHFTRGLCSELPPKCIWITGKV